MRRHTIETVKKHSKTLYEVLFHLDVETIDERLRKLEYLVSEDEGNFLKYHGYASPIISHIFYHVKKELPPGSEDRFSLGGLEEMLADILGGRSEDSLQESFNVNKRVKPLKRFLMIIGVLLPERRGEQISIDEECFSNTLKNLTRCRQSVDYSKLHKEYANYTEMTDYLRQYYLDSIIKNGSPAKDSVRWAEFEYRH